MTMRFFGFGLFLAAAAAAAAAAAPLPSSFQVASPLSPSSLSKASSIGLHASLQSSTTSNGIGNPFASLLDAFGSSAKSSSSGQRSRKNEPSVVENFISAINNNDIPTASSYLSDDCTYADTKYYDTIVGRSDIKRHLYLEEGALPESQTRVIDEIVVDADNTAICTQWHIERDGIAIENERGCSFYTVNVVENKISSLMDVPEPKSKPGDAGLNVLNAASKIIDGTGVGYLEVDGGASASSSVLSAGATCVEKYFDAWNRRDMTAAVACFAEQCSYEDTQYRDAFVGKDKLEAHLLRVADCLPKSFVFVVDSLAVSVDRTKVGVQWHLENGDGEALPFTRGCSYYKLDGRTGLIVEGFDVPEPAVVKTGSLQLLGGTLQRKVSAEPIRLIPIAVWAAYMGIVFISDGILPGANALQLEQRTWEEVRDLSINFFLVSPLLHLPFAPVVHPMLEGVFNLLLSWAAMFAGFLSDEREDKPNLFPMLPAVAGMQFLTSAFLLPYLALRTSEQLEVNDAVYKSDLGTIESTLGEFRGLGALMATVGTGSIAWFFGGRPEFGGFGERYASFIDLLSIDRVGSSFIVDLVIFALFQGWLVDDDMRRRGVNVDGGELAGLRIVAKLVPFFGLAAYLSLRPSLADARSD